jgi:hypothetical protein
MSGLAPGVYWRGADGSLHPVHGYLDDGYALEEVFELLAIGTPCGPGCLELTRHELRTLQITAHAQSFDHAEEFIRMCLDIAVQEPALDEQVLRLVSVD